MAALTKREFIELAVNGSNYLTWALDVEIYLTSTELKDTIVADSTSNAAQKARALIFLRHHLNENLKNEYLTERDPYILWESLKDRFDQQTSLLLPQARYDWLNLRFQDYKSVTEYNSVLHKIVAQLRLCKQEVSDKDLIEKTLSTFHASNLVLQQQYRTNNYPTHAELITALLVAEKHNQLLMRNHNARPVGSAPVPEAHHVAQLSNTRANRGKGRGRGRGRGPNRGGKNKGNKNHNSRNKQRQSNNKGQSSSSNNNSGQHQACYRCGCEGHWSRTCRTPKHLVEAYQQIMKRDKEQPKDESHYVALPEANALVNAGDDEFELEDFRDQE